LQPPSQADPALPETQRLRLNDKAILIRAKFPDAHQDVPVMPHDVRWQHPKHLAWTSNIVTH